MSDTPRHDDPEGQPYRDPTAPGDESFSTSNASSGDAGDGVDQSSSEHTEQLPTSGDTQQVPAPTSPTDAPPNPYGQGYPTQDVVRRRDQEQGGAGQPAYGQTPSQGSYPPPPPPPGYGSATGYGSAPGTQPGYGSQPGNAPSQPGYGTTPYGSAPGDQPGYGNAPGYGSAPGYGTPAHGSPASLSGSTIALLIVSGLLTIGGCGMGIPALVFAILAVTKKDQPAEASKWTRWGWIALGVTLVLAILAVVAVVVLAGVSTNSGTGY